MPQKNPITERTPPESVAEELAQESERLRQLATKLKAREDSLAEMQTNYSALLRFTHAKLQEEFARTLEELPEDVDLFAYAREQGAVAHDMLVAELEAELNRLKEGP